MRLNTNEPIVLGLAGGAATGKTSTADGLAPPARFLSLKDPAPVIWTHLFYAMPLYAMASIRKKMVGVDAFDRQCFALHETLNDLFKGWITYEDTVETAYELASLEFPMEGKPRTFLQKAGTEICRAFDPDCFTKWIARKSREEYTRFLGEWNQLLNEAEARGDDVSLSQEYKQLGVVISDARFLNECKYVAEQPNGVLIKFATRPEVAAERIYYRDGVSMTPEQLMHQSEQELNTVPDDLFDAIIDTSDMTLKEQIQITNEIVEKKYA